MPLTELVRDATCLHDGRRRGESDRPGSKYGPVTEERHREWCVECGEWLREEYRSLVDFTRAPHGWVDPLITALYTRKGRFDLLIELMKERELPIPDYPSLRE